MVRKKRLSTRCGTAGLWDSVKWVILWLLVALSFCTLLRIFAGETLALEFLGGYLIELSLSMDNLFVFLSLFSAFGIPEHARHRVLHWGIIGAMILRLLFILLGVAIIHRFAWVLYLFGALLMVNGVKMFLGEDTDMGKSPIIPLIQRFLPMTENLHGERFIVRVHDAEKHRTLWCATPLLGVLLLIEFSDIIFAIDSVPAVFSVSTHPLIVYSSNILAILGLRQLYFVLEYAADRFCYVSRGVAIILLFTGAKMLLVFFGIHITTFSSILFIFSVLIGSILCSIAASARR